MKITIGEEQRDYQEGTTCLDIARDVQEKYSHDIVLAKVNGQITELFESCAKDAKIEFITTADPLGNMAYVRSAVLLMMKAAYEVAGRGKIDRLQVHFSHRQGIFCTLEGERKITKTYLRQVSDKMEQLVKKAAPIVKTSMSTWDAIEVFRKHKLVDKVGLFGYRRSSVVNIYSLDGFEDYFYGEMVPNTSYIKWFALHPYEDGFVLQLPTTGEPEKVAEFAPFPKLYQVQRESVRWSRMLDIDTVSDLNREITANRFTDIVLVQEALMEKRIGDIAQLIYDNHKRIILIAGPSSSGKTTFSHRLSVQLRTLGLNPHPIAVDNYFVNRENTPVDETGKRDYECLEALDVKQFNEDMQALLDGERVELPTYNFITGKREYTGGPCAIGQEDVLVIEGIHCLNSRLTEGINAADKFKIYISALTALNLDEHNRIATTDGRLIRRMVRDARARAINAAGTIDQWPSVRRGEERNIFPYQEEADIMFNSSLIYELAVLKPYAEQILFSIDRSAPEYPEAIRLLKFLGYFVTADSHSVPNNSLLREFIGGGCFGL